MVYKKNFSEGPALSIGPLRKVQREVIYISYVITKMKIRYKLNRNCSLHSKNLKISGLYNI